MPRPRRNLETAPAERAAKVWFTPSELAERIGVTPGFVTKEAQASKLYQPFVSHRGHVTRLRFHRKQVLLIDSVFAEVRTEAEAVELWEMIRPIIQAELKNVGSMEEAHV